MMMTLVMKRSLLIAVVVGSILNIINQYDVLFGDQSGAMTLSINRYSFELEGSDLEYTPVSVGVEFYL